MSTCSICNKIKTLDNTYRDNRLKSGLASRCKVCDKYLHQTKYNKKSREANRANYQKNKERILKIKRAYRARNIERVREQVKKSSAKRYQEPRYRLSANISHHMAHSLHGQKKGRSWESLVGYTLKKLMNHLERQFQFGMTWKNYGQWHVDHRIPINVFNFSNSEHKDFRKCWALKNLQPMWATENIKKSNRIDRPFQPSLQV